MLEDLHFYRKYISRQDGMAKEITTYDLIVKINDSTEFYILKQSQMPKWDYTQPSRVGKMMTITTGESYIL